MGFSMRNISSKYNLGEKEMSEGTESVNLFPRSSFKMMLAALTYFLLSKLCRASCAIKKNICKTRTNNTIFFFFCQ